MTGVEPIDPDDPEVVACDGPTLNELREASTGRLMLRHLGISMADAQARIAEETQAVALQAVSLPSRLDDYMAEVERRAEVTTANWAASPGHPQSPTPRAAALRSVYEDVAAGRLI